MRGASPGMPDGLHLHMLIFRRLVRWAVGRRDAASLTLRNSLTAPYLWLLSSLAAIPATLFWRSPHVLQAFVALFCVLYVWLYLRLVRFRAPRCACHRSRRRIAPAACGRRPTAHRRRRRPGGSTTGW